MPFVATRLVRPANVVLAVVVGLALVRMLVGHGRTRPVAMSLLESVAGEEDPGSAWEELRSRGGATLH